MKVLDIYEKYIVYVILFLSIFGFIIYIGEKKIDYGESFNWETFLIGNIRCNNTKSEFINKLNYFERASVAFMNPIEIKPFMQKYT